jgi:hypothetical protein
MTPRVEESRTGRARARSSWTGKLILQIEWLVEEFSRCPPPPGQKNDDEWRQFCFQRSHTAWRDATWDDIQARGYSLTNIGHVPPRPLPAPAPYPYMPRKDL